MHSHRPLLGSLSALVLVSALAACAGETNEAEPKAKTDTPTAETAKTDAAAPAEVEAKAGPSNEASKTYSQQWSTPTGQASASLAAVVDGRAYVIAGPYMEFGMPATHLVCLSASDGALVWDHETESPMSLAGVGPEIVDVEVDGARHSVAIADGKQIKPTKAQSDAVQAVPESAHTCTSEGAALTCPGWTVTESGPISAVRAAGSSLCYAVAGAREVRCRASESGDLELVIAVPAVEGVKQPDAVNFSFERIGEQIIVANYDGSVLGFGPS